MIQMDKAAEIKKKILEFLEKNGPSLPVAISREVGVDSLFSSAFLSELSDDGDIKISKMKVGGSPLYLLPKHHTLLENFIKYLNSKEKEAITLLKEKQVLRDIDQEPAIRIALRGLQDFAHSFILEKDGTRVLYWRYFSLNEFEAKDKIETEKPSVIPRSILNEVKEKTNFKDQEKKEPEVKREIEIKEKIEEKKEQVKEIPKKTKETPKKDIRFPKEIIQLPKKPEKIIKTNEFTEKIDHILKKWGIETLEKLESKKKEYSIKVSVESQIGKSPYLCIAKDKKKISENDIVLALQKAQTLNLPILLLTTGTLSPKSKAYLEQYEGLIKLKTLD